MANPLRRIAVHVDEAAQGAYRWILIEQKTKSAKWAEIDAASEPIDTYKEAMAAGLIALEALIDDLDVGPRDAAPSRAAPSKAASPEAAPEEALPKRQGGHFGFGDLPA